MYTHTHTHIYIYIKREKESEEPWCEVPRSSKSGEQSDLILVVVEVWRRCRRIRRWRGVQMWCATLRDGNGGDGSVVAMVVSTVAGRWSADLREEDEWQKIKKKWKIMRSKKEVKKRWSADVRKTMRSGGRRRRRRHGRGGDEVWLMWSATTENKKAT